MDRQNDLRTASLNEEAASSTNKLVSRVRLQ